MTSSAQVNPNPSKARAFATAVLQPGPVLPATAKAALAKLHTFDAQELANTVWSLAKLLLGCPGGLLPSVCVIGTPPLNSRALLRLLVDRPLCDAIAAAAMASLANFVSQHLGQICWRE